MSKKMPKKAATKSVKKPVAKKLATKKPATKVAAKKPAAKPAAKKVVMKAQAKKPVIAAKPMAKPAAKPMPAKTAIAAKPAAAVVPMGKALYKVGNYVVYPTHGVGKIMAEETQMIGEHELRLLVINFERDKMTLRVPMSRAAAAGLRPISSSDQIKKMIEVLRSKAKISRGMWSRRAQEYETKINSGSLLAVAEVVRDLHQNVDQSERSYSERMIYENALNRIVAEYAASEGMDQKTAYDKLMKLLRGKVAAAAAAAAVKEAA
ncbi:MAG: CarD family transcriptional regulator [Alphaproteobacteria bacterium]|nr:CarD family transcriptional regulator [Alphaproteobacteria bacterium]